MANKGRPLTATEEFRDFSHEQLSTRAKAFRKEAAALARRARECESVIAFRDAQACMAAAEAAMKRAREGTCANGVGDCPVHQMGSCKPEFHEGIAK